MVPAIRKAHQHHFNPSSAPKPPLIPLFFFQSFTPLGQDHNDPRQQQKLANLGTMIDYLKEIIPQAMTMTPDVEKLDEHIQLRISPTITPNVPIITGQLKYLTSLKATQLVFKNFILEPYTKLHILHIEIDTKGKYGILGVNSTKIVIHWKTCDANCEHLNGDEKRKVEEKNLYGIFVFELNESNDKILVHNVENLEIDSERDFNDVFGSFAANWSL